MVDDQIPVPWGYFSYDKDPSDQNDLNMEPADWEEDECDKFRSTLPGVNAFVRSVSSYSTPSTVYVLRAVSRLVSNICS